MNLQGNKMEKVNFCKIGCIALLLLGVVASSPLQETEEAITVPAFQFRSQTTDQDVCTAYQVRGLLFVTLARCLGENHGAINQLTAVDIVGQGIRNIQAFNIRGPTSEASEDIAVVMYDGPLEKRSDRSGLSETFGLVPIDRFEREDEADGAVALGQNMRLIGCLLTLFGSMYLVK